ncbi:hypothetical protein N7466_001887 [Penicillium verhagenii]|uniref:uncharacterized protein n=1 Tax=Penicillium verhagenii TaxID=1562060 RepID=UPI002545713A|nr:uncharacterized protein N7466_001887 [Penicillium verhagenii]KAJ5938753.1 hypothetical protein N7466_001887 [Penicillium verhagenii]
MRLAATPTLFAGSRSQSAALRKPGAVPTETSKLKSKSKSEPARESTLKSISTPEFLPWLPSLKSTQLQRIARATGIQSSGTKGVLLERIQSELRNYHFQAQAQAQAQAQSLSLSPTQKSQTRKPWRILSIDMGIRNLAFAFMTVDCPLSKPAIQPGTMKGDDEAQIPLQIQPSIPKLRAWKRLSVSDGLLDLIDLTSPPQSSSPSSSSNPDLSCITSDKEVEAEKQTDKDKDKEKESYSPDKYASNAYTLITTLLSTYNPTHILIERQRFRSGGSSVVQEWTLRVGVFEGMLYAILHTLCMERGIPDSAQAGVLVEGVEPKRVVGYWDEIGAGNGDGDAGCGSDSGGKEKVKVKVNAREVKKAKMGIVGGWVEASLGEAKGGKVVVGDGATPSKTNGRSQSRHQDQKLDQRLIRK